MKIIPTAEDFMLEKLQSMDQQEVENVMIEFARLHVRAALKAACSTLPWDDKMNQSIIDTMNIIKSYPLENIK